MAHPATTGTTALSFSFSPSFSVRTVLIDGEPWFVAKDILSALDYAESSNASRVTAHVPEEWRGVKPIHTPSGEQNMSVLSEHGLYFFLGRSDKPKALPFQKWLAGEVIPAIRKTGRYEAPAPANQYASSERLSSNDFQNIRRIVWIATHHMRFESSWTQAIWFYLRRATSTPYPQEFSVHALPSIATELTKVVMATEKVNDLVAHIERQAAKRIFRKGECADVVVADLEKKANDRMNKLLTEIGDLPTWLQSDMNAIAKRLPCKFDGHTSHAEQADFFATAA